MHSRGEAVAQGQARSDGPPQPALDPLLAHFSAMGMAQVPFPCPTPPTDSTNQDSMSA